MNHWKVMHELEHLVSAHGVELCTAYLKLEKQLEVCKEFYKRQIMYDLDINEHEMTTLQSVALSDEMSNLNQELEKVEG
jgi:hypothetical protein